MTGIPNGAKHRRARHWESHRLSLEAAYEQPATPHPPARWPYTKYRMPNLTRYIPGTKVRPSCFARAYLCTSPSPETCWFFATKLPTNQHPKIAVPDWGTQPWDHHPPRPSPSLKFLVPSRPGRTHDTLADIGGPVSPTRQLSSPCLLQGLAVGLVRRVSILLLSSPRSCAISSLEAS